MNTSLSWIKMYVPDLDVTAQEYTDAMTLTGTKVEGFEKLDADLDKIVIGQIEKIEKHPDADKLIICQVNIGTETVQIVTGAPNVKEGDKVPVVLDGGRVAGGHDGKKTPGGIEIKKGAIELLDYLKAQGIRRAIATATDQVRTEQYLKQLGLYGYFDQIICATMVEHGKPSPDIYQYACRQLALLPEECIAVEDSPNGVCSAYGAGCNVVMVPDQTEPDEALRGKLAARVDSLDEIIKLFKKFPGLTKEDEEHQLSKIIEIAQDNLDHAKEDIRKINEDLADLLEVYDAKDKEGLALWNNATARLKEDERELVRYEKARKKPYFGRIDFRDPKAKADEAYYIGRVGITDSSSDPVVLDWRAPIASVYYESRMGTCQYTVSSDGDICRLI